MVSLGALTILSQVLLTAAVCTTAAPQQLGYSLLDTSGVGFAPHHLQVADHAITYTTHPVHLTRAVSLHQPGSITHFNENVGVELAGHVPTIATMPSVAHTISAIPTVAHGLEVGYATHPAFFHHAVAVPLKTEFLTAPAAAAVKPVVKPDSDTVVIEAMKPAAKKAEAAAKPVVTPAATKMKDDMKPMGKATGPFTMHYTIPAQFTVASTDPAVLKKAAELSTPTIISYADRSALGSTYRLVAAAPSLVGLRSAGVNLGVSNANVFAASPFSVTQGTYRLATNPDVVGTDMTPYGALRMVKNSPAMTMVKGRVTQIKSAMKPEVPVTLQLKSGPTIFGFGSPVVDLSDNFKVKSFAVKETAVPGAKVAAVAIAPKEKMAPAAAATKKATKTE